jgi:hypothetical protein
MASLQELLSKGANQKTKSAVAQAETAIGIMRKNGYIPQAEEFEGRIRNSIVNKNGEAFGGTLKQLYAFQKKAPIATPETKDEPYTYLTPEQEVQQYGGPLEGTYVRKGAGGKPERIEPGRTYASPQESFRLEQLKAADQSLTDVKKEAESFLKVTPELNQLSRLLDAGIQTGKFENLVLPLRQFAEDVGLPVGDVANQEQFRALSGQLALTFGQQLKGSMSDGDRALLVDRISPSVATSPEGNKMIIAFYKAGAEKNKKIRNAILQGRKKGLDPYEIEENVNEIVDSDFIADQVKTQFPQLQEQGQQATQPPAINYTPDAQSALERARALQQKK